MLRIYFGEETHTLILKSHKVLSVTFNNIEFRCSYLLTGSSLDKCTNDYNVIHKKLTGSVDYDVVRYQDTKLEKADDMYFINDIVGQHEVIRKLIKNSNGRIDHLPYTKTGYARQYCREQSKKSRSNRKIFVDSRLTYYQYKKVNKAFKGGYTHANYKYRGKLITSNIGHFDFESHYPTVMMLEKYPMSKFRNIGITDRETLDYFNDFKCILLTILVRKCKMKSDKFFSYIAVVDTKTSCVNDNGRVYECNNEFVLHITYEDLTIIEEQYDIDYDIVEVEIADKTYLPAFMRDSITYFFEQKTKLKNALKHAVTDNEKFDLKIELKRVKGILNSLYGMCATCPIRDEMYINDFGEYIKKDITEVEQIEKLEKFYKTRNSFLPYQWSIWVTAYARRYLFDTFNVVGQENVIYGDTDSAFFIKQHDTYDKLNKYNDLLREKSIESNSYMYIDGKKKYFGKFDDEKEDIRKFKVLHSKCYMYETSDKNLHSVIAGVVSEYKDKNGNIHYNTEECNSFKKFDNGFLFSEKFGGTTAKYLLNETGIENIDGHETEISDGVIIEKITKQLHNEITL